MNIQHKTFKINSIIVAVVSAISSGLFIYFSVKNYFDVKTDIIFKIIPLISMNCLILLYMMSYEANLYGILSIISTMLCLLGDVFLELDYTRKPYFFYIGGVCFFISRIIWAVNFNLYDKKIIKYPNLKFYLIHGLCLSMFIGLGTALFVFDISLFNGLLLGYVILGMPIPLSSALLRINRLEHEAISATSLAFIGMLLFNISDLMLFSYLLLKLDPKVHYASLIIYWISMYMLSISVLRTDGELKETVVFIEYDRV